MTDVTYLAKREAETQRMITLWNQGNNLSQIGKACGKKPDTVSIRLRKAGIVLKRPEGTPGLPYSEEEMAAIKEFISLPWNLRNWKELLRQLPGRSRTGVETIMNRLKFQRAQFRPREVRGISQEAAASHEIPPGWYRASNGVVLKHVSIQGSMDKLYPPHGT